MRLAYLAATACLAAAPALAQAPDPHADHQAPDHDMAGMAMGEPGNDIPMMAMPSMDTREASGTAWQPQVTPHEGQHVMAGPWMVMTHATLNLVYDDQSGPRGDDKTFVSGMLMAMAKRNVGHGDTLQLRAMLSPDPFMGKRGYPLLLASGETADGVTPLIDRQHPHDLFMELSARYDHVMGPGRGFLYAGLPGEPAFGPPAFMHRLSIMDSPEAPISHHWLDSTHIAYGVVTAGYIMGDWKLEASRFKGREPDEHRWDIENPKLDSTAVRLAWNPTPNWSLQTSWAHQVSPEQLEPDENQDKWSASAIYTAPLGDNGLWSATLAWGRRTASHGPHLDAFALEAAVKPTPDWTVFARAEQTETDELSGHGGPVHTVGKASLGVVRDFRLTDRVKVGLGGLYAVNAIPDALEPLYGGDPHGAMVFLRLKLQ